MSYLNFLAKLFSRFVCAHVCICVCYPIFTVLYGLKFNKTGNASTSTVNSCDLANAFGLPKNRMFILLIKAILNIWGFYVIFFL